MRPRTRLTLAAFALVVLFHCWSTIPPAWSDDRRTDKTALRIMTLNPRWLWDGWFPEAGSVSFPWKGDPSQAAAHMEAVAQVVRDANVDIVCLQEVEDWATLLAFNGKLAGMGYVPYFLPGTDTVTGQNVAILTRVDPEGALVLRDKDRARLGSIETDVAKNVVGLFTIGDIRFALINLHLTASPTDPASAAKRDVEATAILALMVHLRRQGYSLVVLGDLNDYDGSPDALDANNNLPLSHVLANLRHPFRDNPPEDLWNVAAWLPQAQRYTAWFDTNGNGRVDVPPDLFSGIDHVLLSQELAVRIVPGAGRIPHNYDPAAVTDHFPVITQLRTGTAPPPALYPWIRIFALVPDPVGLDSEYEEVTIWNTSSGPVNLVGWKLRDIGSSGRIWWLDALGTLGPGKQKTILRAGMSMSLNNDGDTIRLEDPFGTWWHVVRYDAVAEGERVVFP
jgi:exonuclease III